MRQYFLYFTLEALSDVVNISLIPWLSINLRCQYAPRRFKEDIIMQLASIIDEYHDVFVEKYGPRLLPGQFRAIDAIRRCRTQEAEQLLLQYSDCGLAALRPCFCGHRSCPQCQNHETSLWLDRQQTKLLPVEYFIATFTLPYDQSRID